MLWIVIAVFLSIFALMLLRSVLANVEPPNWFVFIKDGQLCWGSMLLAFVAMFDASGLGNPDGAGDNLFYFALLVLISAFIAALGFIEPVQISQPARTSWYRHFGISIVSVLTTIFVVVGYAQIQLIGLS